MSNTEAAVRLADRCLPAGIQRSIDD